MYNETKVVFVVWLWHPRTQGAPYAYEALLAPLLRRHEPEIDARLANASATVGQSVTRYGARASAYVQSRFVSFVHSLPQAPGSGGGGGGGGFTPRTANEAAAMAFVKR
jgi:receptor expression-enhancing protein 1/2/3/4